MKILIAGPEDDNNFAYTHLIKVAKSLEEKGNQVCFALPHTYYPKAAGVDLSCFRVYAYNQWTEKKIITNIVDNLSVFSYPGYFKLICWNTKKELRNYKRHLENHLILKLINFFSDLIEKENIDFIMYENVSDLFLFAAYYAAKLKNIIYIGWIISRIPKRYELWTDPYGNIDERRKLFQSIIFENINEVEINSINKYIAELFSLKPDYMKSCPSNININYLKYYFNNLDKILVKLNAMITTKTIDAYSIRYPMRKQWRIICYKLKRKIKIYKLTKYFASIDLNESFFLFPLHYQPESSISVNAAYYCNQAEVVKNIAFSLPQGTKLYVKDHPNGMGFMALHQYYTIFSLPNVKYIPPDTDNKILLRNCIGVITLTSTMGYEALLLGKGVITLGNVFYNYHPHCFHASGYEELYKAIRFLIKEKDTDFTKENIRFVKSYMDTTFTGSLFAIDDESIDNLTSNILSFAKANILNYES